MAVEARGSIAYTVEPPEDELAPRIAPCTRISWHGKELSDGHLDCRRNRGSADDRAVGSVLHLVRPSRKGAWSHLVHVVEAAGSPRHWPGRWWIPTDSTRQRRCAWGSLLIG